MNYPLPGVLVDPQGVSTSVAITDSHGNTPTVYADRFAVTTITMPDTITARKTYYLPGEGPWTVTPTANGEVTAATTLTLEDAQIATVTVGSAFTAGQWSQLGAYVQQDTGPTGSDDTARVQALLNAGSVELKPNQTYIFSGLSVPADTVLNTKGCTIHTLAGATAVITLGDRARVKGRYTIDLTAAPAATGIDFGDSTDATAGVGRVINGTTGHGVSMGTSTGAVRPTLSYVSTDSCYYGVLLNHGTIDALIVGGADTNGKASTSFEGSFYAPNCSRTRVVGRVVQNSAGHGFYDQGTDNTFEACVARSNGTAGNDHRGATIDTATRSTWIGCDFLSNVEAGLYDRNTSVNTTIIGGSSIGNNTGDRAGGHGYELDGARSTLTGATSQGQLGNTSGAGCGVFIGADATVDACTVRANWTDGIRFGTGSQGAIVTNNKVSNNGQGGAGGFGHGINQQGGATVTDFVIMGNHCYDDQTTKTQGYGLVLGNANVNFGVCVGNVARATENISGGLLNSGGANNQVANNVT